MTLHTQSLPYVRAISPYQPGKPIQELAADHTVATDLPLLDLNDTAKIAAFIKSTLAL